MTHAILSLVLSQAGHNVRLSVIRAAKGWELREERDDAPVRITSYTDWHRVERSIRRLELAEGPPAIWPAT